MSFIIKMIEISEYNPAWQTQFQNLYDHIWPEIADIAISIEHVGSTSVEHLPAKPIIDLTIVVENQENMGILIQRLNTLSSNHRGDLGIQGREAFTQLPTFPKHHLYACIAGSQGLRNHIAFRDYLRAHPKKAIEYGLLKKELAKKFPHDIDAYVEGKSSFILSILNAQGFSEEDLDEIKDANTSPT